MDKNGELNRRRFLMGIATAPLVGGCDVSFMDNETREIPDKLATSVTFNHNELSDDALKAIQDMARAASLGYAVDKKRAQAVLDEAIKDYEFSKPDKQALMRDAGVFYIHKPKEGEGGSISAVWLDFGHKAIVAVKGIRPFSNPQLPIMDLRYADRAGGVIKPDKSSEPQIEGAYLNLANKLQDQNLHQIAESIEQAIVKSRNIGNLNIYQLAALNDDEGLRVMLGVSDKVAVTIPFGRDAVFKQFQGKRNVIVSWNEGEKSYEARVYDSTKEAYMPAGKINANNALVSSTHISRVLSKGASSSPSLG